VQVGTADIGRALHALKSEPQVQLRDLFDDQVSLGVGRRAVGPRGVAQKRYVESIRAHDLTFGIGPAGTGKTYLAMACAVSAYQARQVKRIVLTRPAVEAGEKLGFLPGDLAEKVNPYLRPLYDALDDMLDIDKAQGLIARGHIEVAPLAFMRGRTLNDCFVILDEAQNTTSEQMRMFLTRLGYHSKAVVTGDVTQVDLPDGRASGLREARELLDGVEGIAFCHFTDVDVVRHPLVQKIIVRYEARDRQLREARERKA
jgi:phosphate starvation-inducible PhoH-like protein